MPERKKCARCGREGSRNFADGSAGLVCDNRGACDERMAAAERGRSVHRSDWTDRNGKPTHSYRIDGERVPGVTTLLSDGIPKPALVGWGINAVSRYAATHLDELWAMRGMGEEAVFSALRQSPYTDRNDAAARGTTLHGYAEKLMRDEPVDVPADLLPWVEAVVSYLDDWQPRTLLQEVAVGNKRWRYGGTLDDVSEIPGRLAESSLQQRCTRPGCSHTRKIVDYKSGKGVYAETALQLAAYAEPENVFKDPETGVERTVGELDLCDEGYVVHIRPNEYRVVPAYIGPEVRQAFVRVAWLARLRAEGGQLEAWLGEPLPPPTQRSGS